MVYILNMLGQPLMPTKDYRKVRLLLKQNKAIVVSRTPFTIQLTVRVKTFIQPITLGVDAGSKIIGLSASTEKQELYAAEVQLRNDIVELLSTRRELRRARRNRKTRYRKPRFNNRNKPTNWLAPSIVNKIDTHIKVVDNVYKLLPINKTVVEVASFDIQKIKNPSITGTLYQLGEQLGFWNVREYVLFRDGHKCQCCKGKSKDNVLNVHHIESRKTGGDAPNNLITLCETCHTNYHKGLIELPKTIKRGMVFKDAAFMGIMRWAFYNKLKSKYNNVSLTYGYITKKTRIDNKLIKTHAVDALCISGHPTAKMLDSYYIAKKVRCHNRQLHKLTINKNGYRKSNQSAKYVYGYQLFDQVLYNGQVGYIFGRRSSGSFDIRQLDGTKLSSGVSYKKLVPLVKRKSILVQEVNRFCSSP